MPDEDKTATPWICCQIGAREHYAIPRALHQSACLRALFTDAWIRPGNLWGKWAPKLGQRFHPDLADASVSACTTSLIGFELTMRGRGVKGWQLVAARNRWFQKRAVRHLRTDIMSISSDLRPIVFAYSYAALEIFRYAKSRGWKTVLGQIDPGEEEERIVEALASKNSATSEGWEPAPIAYWEAWRKECEGADHIVVNSKWSLAALEKSGVGLGKTTILPLAFDSPTEADGFVRQYPSAFTLRRPLRVLFLGQINLRKGLGPLLGAMCLLKDEPVEFWMVGPLQIDISLDLKESRAIRWIGAVPRHSVAQYYRDADIFLFPTFSDGFGLTQLEAQAWQLPVIASHFCGDVIMDGQNGWLLPEVTTDAIVERIRACLNDPSLLQAAARKSRIESRFTLASLKGSLCDLIDN